jgi:serine/threonine-protein kinase
MDLRDQLQASLGGRYTLKHELGGGMSRVFVATEQALFRDVVIKVLPPELAAHVSVERFRREILLAARLQHAHIVPLLAAGDANGLPYYTMPFVEGESLRTRLSRIEPLPLGDAARILREIASALAYAHEHGVVHRDIKPDNILLSSGAAMVSDFGVAKALFASSNAELGTVTSKGLALGTPAYMAPEQMSSDGSTDHRADIYSFGVVAYEMLSGTPPFSGRTPHDILAAHVLRTPEHLASRAARVPEALAAVVMRCLEKDPANRPQSAADVMQMIDAATTSGRVLPSGRAARFRRRVTTGVRRPAVLAVIAAVAILAMAATWLRWHATRDAAIPAGDSARAIVVLPFVNVGGDTATEYFADGMTDAVSTEIAHLPGIRVAARSSAFRYKDQNVNVAEVGRALRVGSVVLGSVLRSNGRVRITAQLVNARDGMVRWSNSYEKPLTQVFDLQDEIATAIAKALDVTFAGVTPRLPGVGTQNVQAYDLYLRAMAIERRYTEPDIRRSIGLFQQAIAMDSNYAAPWAGIAKAWINLADDWLPPREAYPRARDAVHRALALDSTNAEAHAMLGNIAFDFEWDVVAAVQQLSRAVALDPANVDARIQFARMLMRAGATDSALAQARRAQTLDPTAADLASDYAHLLVRAGLPDSAERWVARERELDPNSGFASFDLGFVRMAQGRWADALRAYEGAVNFAVTIEAHRAMCEAYLGRTADARRRLAALEALRAKRYVAADRVARVYVALHDDDGAFRWLERGFAERAAALVDLSGFVWDPIRSDPRFVALTARIAASRP